MKLYELSERYNALACLLDEDGADEEGLKGQIALIQEEFKDKAESIGKIILSQTGEIQTVQTELDRLTNRKRILETKTEWMKGYLLNEMVMSGVGQIKGNIVTLSLRTNPPSCNVVNPALIPEEYRRIIPQTWQPDKLKILQTVKLTGEVIPGCQIVTDKKSLSVR
jgi:hypothetical protein